MQDEERRRYFRINEVIGLSIEVIGEDSSFPQGAQSQSVLELISQQDEQIEKLLRDTAAVNPAVSELLGLLNQKIERVSRALAMEHDLIDRIAHRVQEVNLSACGIAFHHSEPFSEGAHIQMELTLLPDKQKILSKGVVLSCDQTSNNKQHYYCRADFYGMSASTQEKLIQFIVQCQSQQLKARYSKVTE